MKVDKRRYLFSIMYDGSDFFGLVKQPKKRTILGEMESSFFSVFGHSVSIMAASRTDAGVHAYDQKILIETQIKKNKLVSYWNKGLPSSILIKDCKEVLTENFHVRYSVKEKLYLYKIVPENFVDPFISRFITKISTNFSISVFAKALSIFEGKHDFNSVVTFEPNTNTIREIKRIRTEAVQNQIHVYVIGQSFLRHMVRRIIGCAIACAENQITINELKKQFINKVKIKYKAPAQGLYLAKVTY